MDEAQVTIVATEMLKVGKTLTNIPDSIQLSIYDCLMRHAQYQKRILFYNTDISSTHDVVSSLKDSLAKVLISFYPFAARMRDSSTLDCTDLSVQFCEAVTEASMDEIQKLEFSPSKFCDQLCQAPSWPWSCDSPLLYVQVTRFLRGGISIGIAFSHHICDGVSAWHFFSSWGQLSRAGAFKNPPVVSHPIKQMKLTQEETTQLASSIGFVWKDNPNARFIPAEQLSTKLFKVDKETIFKMKLLATKERMKLSTYDVICGYFWRQITIARGLDAERYVKLFVLFDCRGRYGGVPKFHFGNAISMAIVTANVGELVENGFAYGAQLIHETVAGFDERKNQAQINFLDEAIDKGFATAIDIDPDGFSLVVSSPRHPVYECDFGFGKPDGVTFGTNDLHAGKIYLFPSRDDGGVDVRVVLRPEEMYVAQVVK